MPPPKLYTSDADAPQPERTEQRINVELETMTFASRTEANTAPPAALKAPKYEPHDVEKLSMKTQDKMFKREDCAIAMYDAEEILGYTYELNIKETAPPKEKASFE